MNVGGPAVLLEGLAKLLSDEIFELHLITGECSEGEIDYLQLHPDLEKYIFVHRISNLRRTFLPLNDFLTFIKLLQLIRSIRPDIVHTHMSKAGLLGRIAAKVVSTKIFIIHTYHGHLLYGYFSSFKLYFLVRIERSLARITNLLVAVTQQVESDLKQVGIGLKNDWTVIHPGIAAPNLPEKRSNFSRLIWIGRFTNIKNPFLAIDIFENILKIAPNACEFTMVGGGELFEAAKEEATTRNISIEFTSWTSDVFSYLTQSSALLITSKNEGMPLVLIEAASIGIPTFSTDVGGISEFISDGETGFLIEQNAESAAMMIVNSISNIDLMKRVSENIQKKFAEDYSLDSYSEKHNFIYLNAFNRYKKF